MTQATASIIGLGLYELYLNGQRVGNQVLAPRPTNYTQGMRYNAFGMMALLQMGANASSYCIAAKCSFAEEDKKAPFSLGNA